MMFLWRHGAFLCKWCGVALLVGGLWFVAGWPDHAPRLAQAMFDELPDARLVDQARAAWAADDRATALALLDLVIEQDLPDRPAAEQTRADYRKILADECSLFGRLWQFGVGFTTGDTRTGAGRAGATVGDFFAIGDVRDLIVESCKDDPDGLIQALSLVGLVLDLGTPSPAAPATVGAQAPINVLKAAKRCHAISRPLANAVKKAVTLVDAAKGPARLMNDLEPIARMTRRTSSFGEMFSILKRIDSLEVAREVADLLDRHPTLARTLATVGAVIGENHRQFSEVVGVLAKHGAAGDVLKSALRKGSAGVSFVLSHPKVFQIGLKAGRRFQVGIFNHIEDRFAALVVRYGWKARLGRAVLLLLLALGLARLLGLHRLLPAPDADDEAHSGKPSPASKAPALPASPTAPASD